jgi:hypothetical protein
MAQELAIFRRKLIASTNKAIGYFVFHTVEPGDKVRYYIVVQ